MAPTTDKRFPTKTLAAIHKAQVVGIRAGRAPHRIIAVWVVVVRQRVFIRSWRVSRTGWYFAFKRDRNGILTVGERTMKVTAVMTRGEVLKREVSRGYADKYRTPGSRVYVRDLSRKRCRDATIELVPWRRAAP